MSDRFHTHDGIYVGRSFGDFVEFHRDDEYLFSFNAAEWASIVAFVSVGGSSPDRYKAALELHRGNERYWSDEFSRLRTELAAAASPTPDAGEVLRDPSEAITLCCGERVEHHSGCECGEPIFTNLIMTQSQGEVLREPLEAELETLKAKVAAGVIAAQRPALDGVKSAEASAFVEQYIRRSIDKALSSLPPLRASQDGWQPWETAPINEVVDWWIDSEGEGGWLKRGYRCNSADPLAIVEEDGGLYWPHENGGWPTHWQPLPKPPASLRASQEKQG